jgi:type IX secretion system PorP/SprF family membrane protein
VAFQSGDVALASNINKIVPIAGAGIFYQDHDFYVGVSVPDMITFASVQNYATDKNLYQVNEIHYFITSGLHIDVNDQLSVQPSVLLKSIKGAPLEADFNTRVELQKKVGLGISYRTSEAILALFDTQLSPQFRVGYAYDMPFKRPNSHELFLRYNLGRLFK